MLGEGGSEGERERVSEREKKGGREKEWSHVIYSTIAFTVSSQNTEY